MKDSDKIKKQLLNEIDLLKTKITVLNKLENKHKKKEHELQESGEKYRLIMETSIQGISQVDANGCITFANPAVTELSGYSLIELDGMSLDTLYPPGKAKVISDINVALLYSGKSIIGENTLTRKDGSNIETHFSCAPVFDENGKYAGFIASILDITERKQAEEELKAANQQLTASEQQLRSANQQLIANEQQLKVSSQQLIANEQQLKVSNQQLIANEQQLKATNQQLSASEQQLRSANQQLEASNRQLIASEEEIKKHAHDLDERVKELGCLYEIEESIRTRETVEEILQDTANIIPPAWHYPEITRGKMRFNGKEYVSQTFKESKWKQSVDIIVNGKIRGSIEVYYLEECPELDEGPFLKEERNLINIMAKTISEAIEHKQAEEELKASNQQLTASEQQLRSANQQLTASEQQLRASMESIKESEEKYRSLVTNIPDVVWTTDCEGKTSYISSNIEDIYGYTPEEVYKNGDSIWFGRIHPEDVRKVEEAFKNLFEKETMFDVEYRIKRKDEEWMWLHDRALKVYEKDGIKYADGIFSDITKHKLAEEKERHLNAVILTIRNINQLIIKEKDRSALIKKACENFIETRGFHTAWIALINKESTVSHTAEGGFTEDFQSLEKNLMCGKIPLCMKKALEQDDILLIEDVRAFCADCPVLKKHTGSEISIMVKRLEFGGKIFGILNLSLPSHFITDKDEQSLFKEVADDIAFALNNIDLEEQRKQADKALQKSESQYRLLAENAVDFIFYMDLKLKFIYVSPYIYNSMGYYPEEVIGTRLFKYTSRKEFIKIARAAIGTIKDYKSNPIALFETELINKKGEKVPVEVSGRVVLNEKSKPIGLQGNVRDITERKQADIALKESEYEKTLVLDNMSELIVYKNTNMKTIWASKSVSEFLDIIPEENIGRVCYKARYNKNTPCRDCKVVQVLKTGKTLQYENTSPDGRYWFVRCSPVHNESDEIIGTVEVSMDITERKQAEEKEKHLNAVILTIRNINQLIIQEKDRNLLIKKACENFIEARGFQCAWIALFDEKNKLIHFEGEGLGNNFYKLKDNILHANLPQCINKALQQDNVVSIKDVSTDCNDCPMVEMHKGKDRSVMSRSLKYGSKCYGVVSVSLPSKFIADKEEQSLFDEVAGDIAYALYNIEVEEQRQKAEEALAKKTMLLDNVINRASNIAVATTDLDLRITSYNPVAEKFFGYTPEEVLGKTVIEMHLKEKVEPERLEKAIEIVKKTGEYNYIVTQELQSEKRVLSSRVTGMLDPAGKLVGYVLFSRDVTELVLAEEALQESETKYRLIAENNVDFIFQMDLKLKFLYMSPSLYDVLDFYPEEVIGTRLFQYATRKEFIKMARIAINLIRQYKRGNKALFESKLINKNGEEIPVEISGKVLLNEKGKPIGIQGNVRDISNRKKAEKALAESENNLRTLFNAMIDIVFEVNYDGRIINVAPTSPELVFKPTEDIIDKTLHEIFPKPQADKFLEFIRKCLDENKTAKIEYPLVIDNKTMWFEGRGTPKTKNSVLYIARDVTDRKKAEKALAESEHNLRSLFNAMTDVVFEMDYDGRYINIAPTSPELMFKPPKDIIGKTLHEVFPKPEADIFLEFIRKCLDENKTVILEYPLNIDDKTIWFEGSATPKTKNSVLYIARDITERKQAEEALHESEEKFRNFVETSADLVFRLNKTGHIDYVSPRVKELYGYQPDDLIGKSLKTTTPIGEVRKAIKALNMILAGKSLNNLEINQKTRTGRVIPMEINAVPVYQSGKIVGLQGIMRDITKRKQAENVQKALYEISDAINTTDDLHLLCQQIREFLGSVIDTTNFYVALYDEETDMISLPFDIDEKDNYETFPAGKSLTAYVIETGKSLLVDNKLLTKLIKEGKVEDIGTSSKIWLGAPLKIENKVIGVVVVQSYDDPNLYTENDIDILTYISEAIAIAIDKKRAEQQIKRSLKEKTILLQELYHRTKNNMQLISSMLKIQSRSIENRSQTDSMGIDFLLESFNTVINKIKAMSLVHQKLYQANDLSHINLKEYIKDLVRLLMISYGIRSENITLKLELEDVFVLIDSAIPLGLVLNELISNVFKHAFPYSEKDEIFIRLYKEKDETINIHLRDNGTGIPSDLNLENVNTMGLQTVFDLIKYQLMGEVKYKAENGLKWELSFKDNLHKERV